MENTLGFGGGLYLPKIQGAADTSIIIAQPPKVCLAVQDAVSVKAGENVSIGTAVGINRGMTVYASVSGTVREAENGRVVIENDTKNQYAKPLERPADTCGELINYMRKISLVGMGGAGFPTAKKYESTAAIKFLLINACECEPHLSCDRALISNMPKRVIRGAQALAAAIGSVTTFICVKHRDLLGILKDSLQDESIRIVEASKKYPQGSEKQLISAVLRREVPRFRLPKDCGVIVSNCSTAAAFAQSLETLQPTTGRIVTVAGRVGKPSNILAPCGTSLRYLLDLCAGYDENSVVIEGGAMTGKVIDIDNTFVTLATTGFVAVEKASINEKSCIHCGGCVRVCPSRIIPYKIDAAERRGDKKVLKALCADACISCGCCSYVCPAKRELAEHTSGGRRIVYAEREAQK